jgi:hypothetical protein
MEPGSVDANATPDRIHRKKKKHEHKRKRHREDEHERRRKRHREHGTKERRKKKSRGHAHQQSESAQPERVSLGGGSAPGGSGTCHYDFLDDSPSSGSDYDSELGERTYQMWATLLGRAERVPDDGERAWSERLRAEQHDEDTAGGTHDYLESWNGGDVVDAQEDWFDMIAAARAAKQAAQEAMARAERAASLATAQRQSGGRHASSFSDDAIGENERRRRQAEAEAALDASTRQKEIDTSREVEVARARARAAYANGWAALLEGADPRRLLCVSDFPWPQSLAVQGAAESGMITVEAIEDIVLLPGISATERRKALQSEMRRWHPDKFGARWGGRLVESDAALVLERVKQVAQSLNELLKRC